jgi:signal transduction histidine kinase
MKTPPVRVMRTAAVLAMALGIGAVAILLVIGRGDILFRLYVAHNALSAMVLGVIVWLVVPRQPSNRVIWVLALAAVAGGLYAAGLGTGIWLDDRMYGIAFDPAHTVPVSMPTGLATLLAVSIPFYVLGFFSMSTFGLLLFPNGRLAAPRWRAGSALAGLGLVVTMVGVFWDMRPDATRTYVAATRDPGPVALAGLGLLIVATLISLAGFVSRFRHSVGPVRQQFKWVGAATTILAVLSFIGIGADPLGGDVVPAILMVALTVFLIGYGVAIGRYRLYDADLVINRTVVFALLAGFITLVYVVVVVGIGEWFPGSDSSLVLSVLATALVALVFEPVRLQAQRWANRLVYGNRSSPYEVLSYLTTRLAATESLDGLLGRMAERLADGTGAERATVWLVDHEGLVVGATSSVPLPSPVGELGELPGTVFPISHGDQVLGAFSIEKKRGDTLSPTEERLARDLAGSAGMVLRNARLNTDLATRAAELRESSRRLVDAQDVERRRLERELHDRVEQAVVSLKVKIGLAGQLAHNENNGRVPDLLRQMAGHAQEAIDQIRSVSKGIYPSLLQSDGLAALAGLVEQFPGLSVEVDEIGRLPPEVESAVWFAVSEAVTNAFKHGEPPIRVVVSAEDGTVSFQVSDSGPGFDEAKVTPGSGLLNMRDRVEALDGTLSIASRRGTRVRGVIPVQPVMERVAG